MNNHSVTLKLAHTADFAAFGMAVMAYVKKIEIDGQTVYAVHSADGAPLGIEHDERMAMLVAQQKNLFPVSVQ